MSAFKTFQEIKAWQLSREFCNLVSMFIRNSGLKYDYSLKDQLNRSSGSVMDNIAEGFCRGGNKEFINFLRYSKGSIGEAESQLIRAYDRQYIGKEEFDKAMQLAEHISAKNQTLIDYLLGSEFKGPNYRSKTQNPKPRTQNSKLGTQNSGLETHN